MRQVRVGCVKRLIPQTVRYLDQVLLACVMLVVNLFAPLILRTNEAADLLYESSLVLLGSVVSAAAFGTPYAARIGSGILGDERNVLLGYLSLGVVLGIACTATHLFYHPISLQQQGVIAFAYFWGGVDLLRRIALGHRKLYASAALSIGSVCSVSIALGWAYVSREHYSLFWLLAAGSLSVTFVLVLAALNRSALFLQGPNGVLAYLKVTFSGAAFTLGAYLLGWVSTQGFFVILRTGIDDPAFVETKWMFTVLGVFGIAMAVQENKYQPLISGYVRQADAERLQSVQKKIERENAIVSVIAIVALATALALNTSTTLLTGFFLLVHRQSFARSKPFVYIMRAHGEYSRILWVHVIVCLVAYATAIIGIGFGQNGIALGLGAYGLGSYLLFSKMGSRRKSAC